MPVRSELGRGWGKYIDIARRERLGYTGTNLARGRRPRRRLSSKDGWATPKDSEMATVSIELDEEQAQRLRTIATAARR